MKKLIFLLVALIMVMTLAFSGVLQSVQANQFTNNNPGPSSTPTSTVAATAVVVQSEGVADGDWSTGTEPSIDLSTINPPKSYMQLLGEGVTASDKGRICHPFRGGEYGWWGNIYQLDHGKWTKVTTFFTRVPDSEGPFMACTYATPGGTYALFGAYDETTTNPTATLPPTATPTKTPTPKPTAKPTSKPQVEPTRVSRQ